MTDLPTLTANDTIVVNVKWHRVYGLWCACIELGANGLAQGCWGSEIPRAQVQAIDWLKSREKYRDAHIEWRMP